MGKILENKDDKDGAKIDDEAEDGQEIPRTFSLLPMTANAKKEAARDMNTPLAEVRARYLLEVKAAYATHYEGGLMAPESFLILDNSISDALDRCDEELHDWKFLHGLVHYGLVFKWGIRW